MSSTQPIKTPTTSKPATSAKRVSGGLILSMGKGKKKRKISSAGTGAGLRLEALASASSTSSSSPATATEKYSSASTLAEPSSSKPAGVPSILTSAPRLTAKSTLNSKNSSNTNNDTNNNGNGEHHDGGKNANSNNSNGEFDHLFNNDDDDDIDYEFPSDALMCLQSYTRSSNSSCGVVSENCAYCPIFSIDSSSTTTINRDGNNNDNTASQRLPLHYYDISNPPSAFNDDDETTDDNNQNNQNSNNYPKHTGTHAAPFLPRHLIIYNLLNNTTNTHTSTSDAANATNLERDIQQLALQNKIRLLQLHGTAIGCNYDDHNDSTNNNYSRNDRRLGIISGNRGDGNDDDDVAIMETSVYDAAAEMALTCHFLKEVMAKNRTTSISSTSTPCAETTIEAMTATIQPKVYHLLEWYTKEVMPQFAGRTWISSMALEAFLSSLVKASTKAKSKSKLKSSAKTTTKTNITTKAISQFQVVSKERNIVYSMIKLNAMVQDLVHAGLLLPRRGLGNNGGEGYWFSLPGLGHAAKSIASGRISILRRIKQSKYKEKKRSVLEQEIGREGLMNASNNNAKNGGGDGKMKKKKNVIQQSGKFLVLDLLAKGWVTIHETCAGEHFVRLVD